MTVVMRKVDGVWVRPDAVESIAPYSDAVGGSRSIIYLTSGAAHTVSLTPEEVVAILASDPETIRSWGDHRPLYEGTVPRD